MNFVRYSREFVITVIIVTEIDCSFSILEFSSPLWVYISTLALVPNVEFSSSVLIQISSLIFVPHFQFSSRLWIEFATLYIVPQFESSSQFIFLQFEITVLEIDSFDLTRLGQKHRG